MDILEGITKKDQVKDIIIIAILAVLFAGAGAIISFWHPQLPFVNKFTIGQWIFSAEFIGFSLFVFLGYLCQIIKLFLSSMKRPS